MPARVHKKLGHIMPRSFLALLLCIAALTCALGRAPPGGVARDLVVATAPPSSPPDTRWLEYFDLSNPLKTLPIVTPTGKTAGALKVLVSNSGPSALYYRALVTGEMQLFQETFVDGQWRMTSWDWMFDIGRTVAYEILPTQQAILNVTFWDDG